MSSQLPAIRSAVRPFLEKLEAGDRIVVAVSGGADSLALAYALSQEVKKLALQLSAVTIDHQLQNNSAQQANIVVEQMKELGVECAVVKVNVEITEGLEASARKARYGALDNLQADAIFLGHTLRQKRRRKESHQCSIESLESDYGYASQYGQCSELSFW